MNFEMYSVQKDNGKAVRNLAFLTQPCRRFGREFSEVPAFIHCIAV